jgi:hypothetical protein
LTRLIKKIPNLQVDSKLHQLKKKIYKLIRIQFNPSIQNKTTRVNKTYNRFSLQIKKNYN